MRQNCSKKRQNIGRKRVAQITKNVQGMFYAKCSEEYLKIKIIKNKNNINQNDPKKENPIIPLSRKNKKLKTIICPICFNSLCNIRKPKKT